MDALQHVLTRCLGELRDWRAAHAEGAGDSEDVYARIERTLRQLRRIRDPQEAAQLVREIELRIRDEGPISEAFMPSFEALHEAVTRAQASRVLA